MDFRNSFLSHFIVALVSLILIAVFTFSGIDIVRSTAAVAFILLFLTLIIGPIMRLWRPSLEALPWDLPWSWRGELGIWFTIVSIIHILLIFSGRQWDIAGYLSSMRLSDVAGLAAIFLSFILTATSFERVIKFIGIMSWKWLHSFAYVIFYLVGAHVLNHAFLRPGRPDYWIHWLYLAMMIIVIILQFAAFGKGIASYRKNLKAKK